MESLGKSRPSAETGKYDKDFLSFTPASSTFTRIIYYRKTSQQGKQLQNFNNISKTTSFFGGSSFLHFNCIKKDIKLHLKKREENVLPLMVIVIHFTYA